MGHSAQMPINFDLEQQDSTTDEDYDSIQHEAKCCLSLYVVVGIGLVLIVLFSLR